MLSTVLLIRKLVGRRAAPARQIAADLR